MKEADLRRYHRAVSIYVAVLGLIQGVTGLYLTLTDDLDATGWLLQLNRTVMSLHHGLGPVGVVARLATGLGLVFMIVTGLMIRSRIAARASGTAVK